MIKHQILRSPVRYAVGVVIILLAVSVLCVTVGQGMYAATLAKDTEEKFTTIAVPHLELQRYANPQYTQVTEFVENITRSTPGVIQRVVYPGRSTANVSELTPLNRTQYFSKEVTCMCSTCAFNESMADSPCSTATLEVTLTGVKDCYKVGSYIWDQDGLWLRLDGRIDRVIGLQENYADPTGFYINIYLVLQVPYRNDWDLVQYEQYLQELGLVIGGQYLISGVKYLDLDHKLRCRITEKLGVDYIEALDPDCFTLYSYENESGRYDDGNISMRISGSDFRLYRRAELWLYFDENMQPLEGSFVAPLDRSAEEIIVSEEGTQCREALSWMEINNHAFPVIGAERLEHIAAFADGSAEIVEGRNFTAEESETGAKVCVISYDLAQANGIELGDTLPLSFYSNAEEGSYLRFITSSAVRPSAFFYTDDAQMAEPEDYVVVGFYNIKFDPWSYTVESAFEFTPNTIFVPKGSVPIPMEEPGQGMFYAVELENGAIGAFEELVVQSGLEIAFGYFDGGYSAIAPSLEIFRETASRAMLVGIAVYGILLLLYLLLFPAQEKKVLRTMNSLGAPRKIRFAYLLTTVLGTLLPGTLLGMGLGAALWGFVAQKLLEHSGAAFAVELNATQFVLVGISQLVLALLLSAVLALCMTKRSDLMRRK